MFRVKLRVKRRLGDDDSTSLVFSLVCLSEFKGLAPLSTFESLETLDLRQNPLCNFGNVVSLILTSPFGLPYTLLL